MNKRNGATGNKLSKRLSEVGVIFGLLCLPGYTTYLLILQKSPDRPMTEAAGRPAPSTVKFEGADNVLVKMVETIEPAYFRPNRRKGAVGRG